MIEYKSLLLTRIAAGVVKLNEDQARRRKASIRAMDEAGYYELLRPTEFKVGEVFGYNRELPKALAEVVEKLSGEAEPELEEKPVKKKATKKRASTKKAAKVTPED